MGSERLFEHKEEASAHDFGNPPTTIILSAKPGETAGKMAGCDSSSAGGNWRKSGMKNLDNNQVERKDI